VKRQTGKRWRLKGREQRRAVNTTKKKSTSSKLKTRWYKTYVKKEMIAIEKIENTEAASKSPPKKGNPGAKTKSNEHNLHLKRR